MLTDAELAKLIANWKSQTGTEVRGRMCVPTDTALRVGMFKDLVETLIVNYQYTEEDLLAFKTEQMVFEASINPKSPNKDSWTKLVKEDWHLAVADRFPMQVLSHDRSAVDTSRRVQAPPILKVVSAPVAEPVPEKTESVPEPKSEDVGPFAIEQDEFDHLAESITGDFDREFIADMLSVPLKSLSKKQIDRLEKIRKRIKNVSRAKDLKSSKTKEEVEYAEVDPRLLKDNPIDRSLFEGLPPVNDPVDEEFLKLLKEVADE